MEEATQELALKRLNAEALIAVIESAIGEAFEIAERWRDDAEALADGAAFLMAAATDIRRGVGLLTNLTDTANLVEELRGAGELLSRPMLV